MPTEKRQQNPAVIQQLQREPGRFDFFQAVRLLERAARMDSDTANRNPVARFTPPASECVRFGTRLSMGFPSGDVDAVIPVTRDGRTHYYLKSRVMSLTGATGVLPFHYSEMIFKRLKLKDETLQRFLEMFHHRTLSLFFQAGVKYRLTASYDRHQLTKPRRIRQDGHSHALLSLMGLADSPPDSWPFKMESLLYYSGFFTQQVRTSVNLRKMLSRFFDVPVEIEEFVGKWHDLIDDVRTRLASANYRTGQNACLGKSALVGSKGWFAQGKMRIILGPLNGEQFQRFAPGTRTLRQLNEMVKMFAGAENECEYVLRVARVHIPPRIQLQQKTPPLVGWNAWLSHQSADRQPQDGNIEIVLSSARMH